MFALVRRQTEPPIVRESVLRTRFDLALALAAVLTASAAVSTSVLAADIVNGGPPPLLYETPPAISPDVFAGWWIGQTLGGATANFNFSQTSNDIGASGVLGGVTAGWNWQNGPIVLGLEGDALGANISGSERFNSGANVAQPNIDAMLNLRARAGVTVTPQVLLFVTAGGAWADVDLPTTGHGGASGNGSFFGWSLGGGAEVALNPNWSARFDYQFTNFGSDTVSYPGGDVKYDPDVNTYRGSLIYHF
jgi:outer membrane immunogenic protein